MISSFIIAISPDTKRNPCVKTVENAKIPKSYTTHANEFAVLNIL